MTLPSFQLSALHPLAWFTYTQSHLVSVPHPTIQIVMTAKWKEQSREGTDLSREVSHPPNTHPFSQNPRLQHRKVCLQAENVSKLHNLGHLK